MHTEKEVEIFKRRLVIAANFASHPGDHPIGLAGADNAKYPSDYREGWIEAIEAIQCAMFDDD